LDDKLSFTKGLLLTKMNPVLSDREKEVMECLCLGLSNEKIAQNMHLSITTVKTHLRRMYAKLNASSRLEAVAIYKSINHKNIKP
jgi:LuxR family maltose regulon positive regulatory protein